MDVSETFERESDIAIVGMSGRFPGARTVDELWRNLTEGVESITFFSREELERSGVDRVLLDNPGYVRAKGVLDDADRFDAAFFGYSPREAQIMDPQQRLFLETAWSALENAGYDAQRYEGRIGVFGGVGWDTYLLVNLVSNPELLARSGDLQTLGHGNDKDYLASRVSYKLNLTGPSINVQTACSTSLVAACVACQSLLSGECDMALAGGAFVTSPLKAGYVYYEGGILAPDGHCRAFDAGAGGTVFGNGVGLVVLKRFEDAVADGDYIHAVIRGSAINNDGGDKASYTAPSVNGQAQVVAEAIDMAGIEPATLGYIETHGTGTLMGDPIEVAGLIQAFGQLPESESRCALGSVKTNIGHLDAAAGIAGLIKVALALKHKQLPASLHFDQPNPRIDFEHSPFYVNTALRDWAEAPHPRRAGVSSFGVGGTNAHMILEEAPVRPAAGSSRACQLLLLSTKTPTALESATANLAQHLRTTPDADLAEVAFTLQLGRKVMNHRRMLVCRDREDAIRLIESPDPKRVFSTQQAGTDTAVVFMFSGQGAQYVNMGVGLYRTEPVFREGIDQCARTLQPLIGLDLRDILYPADDRGVEAEARLKETAIAQPAIFAVEYALSQLWMSWGVKPSAVIGHSIGEFAAACVAGVLSLQDALLLVAMRGQLMQALPAGAMLAVPLPEKELEPLLYDTLSLAAVNGPALCVASGSFSGVDALERRLADRGIECRRLHTSHAFHSRMMEPMLEPFAEHAARVRLDPPTIPFLSCVTGEVAGARDLTDPGYWVRHVRQTVRFGDAVRKVLEEPGQVLLEVGPGQTLSTLARQNDRRRPGQTILSSIRHPQENRTDPEFLLTTLGRLWLAGVSVHWKGFYAGERRCRVPLPGYPFEGKRYWIEPGQRADAAKVSAATSDAERTDELDTTNEPVGGAGHNMTTDDGAPVGTLQRDIAAILEDVLGVDRIGVNDDFFDLGGNSLTAAQVIARLGDMFGVKVSLSGFFDRPTVAGLAGMIESGTPVSAGNPVDRSETSDMDDVMAGLGIT